MHWLLLITLAFDLASVKSEPNLERRSDRALESASAALGAAESAYDHGDLDQTEMALRELKESVDLCYQSLADSGKNPRNNSHFKSAEKATRLLLRRLETFGVSVSFADRNVVESIREHLSEIHDNLLNDIMGTRKKK
jgi:hypothetical protein